MIYCKLIKKDDTSATYNYSCGNGEPGVIVFPLKKYSSYIIEKQPEEHCAEIWINKLFAHYMKDFMKGNAKEMLSYEC